MSSAPLLCLSASLALAIVGVQAEPDHGLTPPYINTSPGPEYDYSHFDFGMNLGLELVPSGRFWACWSVGGDDPDAFIVLASSDDRGMTWSRPRVVVDAQSSRLSRRRAVQNGILWTDPEGNLFLFFDQSMTDFDGRAGVWYTVCRDPSADRPTWSPAQRIWHGTTKSRPIVLDNGDWLLPISLLDRSKIDKEPGYYLQAYKDLDPLRMAHVFISSDKGTSWRRRGGVLFPNASYDEHHLVQLQDRSIWMTARTRQGIWQSFSRDRGQTWSQPSKFLNHWDTRHFVRRIRTGEILLVKHGGLDELTDGRTDLRVYVSTDDGATWRGGLQLDARKKISYPDGFQDSDGAIYISYDYNRTTDSEIYMARFTIEDVFAGAFRDSSSLSSHLIYKALGPKRKILPP